MKRERQNVEKQITYKGTMNMYRKLLTAVGCSTLLVISSSAIADGNRYDLPRNYHSEISAAKAYILTNHDKGKKSKDTFSKAVLVDVRRVDEYVAGHPPGAYSIPFPHIFRDNTSESNPNEPGDYTNYIGYDLSGRPDLCFSEPACTDGTNNDGILPVSSFVSYVESKFPDKSTPILTLCRTGYRSVQAANALKAAGYDNVRNIWEGYAGRYKVDTAGNDLDLNGDGAVDGGDTDGWAVYQELPTSTKLHPKRIFSTYSYLYYE